MDTDIHKPELDPTDVGTILDARALFIQAWNDVNNRIGDALVCCLHAPISDPRLARFQPFTPSSDRGTRSASITEAILDNRPHAYESSHLLIEDVSNDPADRILTRFSWTQDKGYPCGRVAVNVTHPELGWNVEFDMDPESGKISPRVD
ncbi:MAG TPA: hypothetical protein VGO93_26560 [Candidatus Xenobia bacterium]